MDEGTVGRPGRWTAVAGMLGLVGLVGAGACASGGATPMVTEPGVVAVVTAGGDTWEVRRSPDVRVNPRVQVPPARAYEALPAVYAELQFPADMQDPAARQIGVSEQRFSRRILGRPPSDFFDCGLDSGLNLPLADRAPIDARIVTQVLGGGDAAEIATTIRATARRSGGNAGVAECRSTGLLEILIGEMVRERAGPV